MLITNCAAQEVDYQVLAMPTNAEVAQPGRHDLQIATWPEPVTAVELTAVSLLWCSCAALLEPLRLPSSRCTPRPHTLHSNTQFVAKFE